MNFNRTLKLLNEVRFFEMFSRIPNLSERAEFLIFKGLEFGFPPEIIAEDLMKSASKTLIKES